MTALYHQEQALRPGTSAVSATAAATPWCGDGPVAAATNLKLVGEAFQSKFPQVRAQGLAAGQLNIRQCSPHITPCCGYNTPRHTTHTMAWVSLPLAMSTMSFAPVCGSCRLRQGTHPHHNLQHTLSHSPCRAPRHPRPSVPLPPLLRPPRAARWQFG